MSRRSACQDASLWHGVVLNWLKKKAANARERFKRDQKDRIEQAKRGGDHEEARKLAAMTFDITAPKHFSRLPYELDSYIRSAKRGCTQSAQTILVYFYWYSKGEDTVDDRVLNFLKAARLRYCKDPKRNIAKALWLVKPKRGNPGRVVSEMRRLTPRGEREAAMMVLDKADGVSEKRAVQDCVEMFRVSERTIRKAAAKEHTIRKDLAKARSGK